MTVSFRRVWLYGFAFVLIALVLLSAQTALFHNRNYRQDEAWAVHSALTGIASDGVVGHLLSMFTSITPENVVQDVWVGLFGHDEATVRYLSTLYALLALGAVYRLAADLFNRQIGLLAIFLLGTWNFFTFFGHEARPYAALIFNTATFQLCWLRVIRHPNRINMGLLVLVAVMGLYQHIFMLYVIVANALIAIGFVKWERVVFQRSFGLLAITVFLAAPRVIAILNASVSVGQDGYDLPTVSKMFERFFEQTQMHPPAIGWLLLITGLLFPVRGRFGKTWTTVRLQAEWPKVYHVAMAPVMLVLAYALHPILPIIPPNLMIGAPATAIIMGFALYHFPLAVRGMALLIILVSFVIATRPLLSNGGYQEIASTVSASYTPNDSRVVIMARNGWEHVPIIYALRERTPLAIPNEALFHVMDSNEAETVIWPTVPQNIAEDDEVASLETFNRFVGTTRNLWVIAGLAGWPTAATYEQWISKHYVSLRDFEIGGRGTYTNIGVTQYRRIPDDIRDIFNFGDSIKLKSWTLLSDINSTACQSLTVESWWLAEEKPTRNFNMTLTLATTNGNGITRNDGPPANTLMLLWETNRLYVDERTVTIPCDTPPGEYVLLMGIYDFERNENLPAITPEGAPLGNLAYLTTVFVK